MPEQPLSKRVLVVDDEPTMTRSTQRIILSWAQRQDRPLSVDVETYPDGVEALAAAQRAPVPSLIFSDTHMPRLDGPGLLRGIRASFPDLPFVLMSGRGLTAQEDAERRLLKAEFLAKPAGTEDYYVFLDRFLVPQAAKRVAVVADDDSAIRESLADLLTHLGFEVLEARDGTETLAYCRNRAVDFVISDFQMGDLDGVRCLIKLRQEDLLMPYLVLSGRNDADVLALITQHGGAYRQKPAGNAVIKDWLRSHAFLPDAS